MEAVIIPASTLASPEATVRRLAGVRLWLWAMAVLVFVMVVVGGATRLTGSGLSITEWKPVTGAVPPLNDRNWTLEFEKYRQSPQYEIQNRGMSLEEFKTIYWWEWSHRQLGRFVGLTFGLGFLVFAGAGVLRGRLLLAVLGLGILGGLQGAIGWLMVASGLKPGMTAVEPVKLMLHLTTASLIFAGLVATATSLGRTALVGGGTLDSAAVALRRLAGWVVVTVLLQIAIGALVAGSKAGLIYNTWPMIDGTLVPPLSGLFFTTPWYENLFDNHLTVQFEHRMVAYFLLGLVLWQAVSSRREQGGTGVARRATALAGIVTAQAAIGIVTLLTQVPLAMGLLHQGFAMVMLAMAVVHWRLLAAGR